MVFKAKSKGYVIRKEGYVVYTSDKAKTDLNKERGWQVREIR
jgi:hypothetical protein